MSNTPLDNQISNDGMQRIEQLIDDVDDLKAREIKLSLSAKIERNTNQLINNSINTSITFNNLLWDIGGLWDAGSPTRLTVPVSGIYLFSASIAFAASAVGVRRVYIRRAGISDIGVQYVNANAASRTEMTFSNQVQLSALQYIELWAFQNSGAALNALYLGDYSITLALTYLGQSP